MQKTAKPCGCFRKTNDSWWKVDLTQTSSQTNKTNLKKGRQKKRFKIQSKTHFLLIRCAQEGHIKCLTWVLIKYILKSPLELSYWNLIGHWGKYFILLLCFHIKAEPLFLRLCITANSSSFLQSHRKWLIKICVVCTEAQWEYNHIYYHNTAR